MKSASLSKDQRATLRFSLLLLFCSGVGVYSVLTIIKNAQSAAFFNDAIMPQIELSGNMLIALDKAQLANRTYAITHEQSSRDQGLKHMEAFGHYYTEAIKLSAAQPQLSVLKEVLPAIEKARAAYMAHVQATDDNWSQLDSILTQINNNAPITLTALNDLTTDQDKKMRHEIASGLAAEKLAERRQKVLLANELLNSINSIREIVFKAQSLLKPELLATTEPLFNEIAGIMQKLRPILYDPVNQQQLDVVGQKIALYQAGVVELAKNLYAGQAINALRIAAGAELERLITRLDQKSTARTVESVPSSLHGLWLTSKPVIAGWVVIGALGLGAAVFISRGVNQFLRARAPEAPANDTASTVPSPTTPSYLPTERNGTLTKKVVP